MSIDKDMKELETMAASDEYSIDEMMIGLSGALLILSGRVQIAAVTKSFGKSENVFMALLELEVLRDRIDESVRSTRKIAEVIQKLEADTT